MTNSNSQNKKLLQSTLIPTAKREVAKKSKVLFFERQKVAQDEVAGHLYFHLRKGAYLIIGRKYGWNPPASLGVNCSVLRYADKNNLKMRVFVKNCFNKAYEADPRPWLDLKAVERRKGVEIYFYPWSRFRTVRDIPSEIVKIFEESD